MAELHGEKIDIVDYSDDSAEFVANALSPARVSRVRVVDPEAKMAQVIVPDYQLSLAIGKEGQNARLAHRLTGWKIDIRPDTAPDGSGGRPDGSGGTPKAAGAPGVPASSRGAPARGGAADAPARGAATGAPARGGAADTPARRGAVSLRPEWPDGPRGPPRP
jgi:N utilization substance protein A